MSSPFYFTLPKRHPLNGVKRMQETRKSRTKALSTIVAGIQGFGSEMTLWGRRAAECTDPGFEQGHAALSVLDNADHMSARVGVADTAETVATEEPCTWSQPSEVHNVETRH